MGAMEMMAGKANRNLDTDRALNIAGQGEEAVLVIRYLEHEGSNLTVFQRRHMEQWKLMSLGEAKRLVMDSGLRMGNDQDAPDAVCGIFDVVMSSDPQIAEAVTKMAVENIIDWIIGDVRRMPEDEHAERTDLAIHFREWAARTASQSQVA